MNHGDADPIERVREQLEREAGELVSRRSAFAQARAKARAHRETAVRFISRAFRTLLVFLLIALAVLAVMSLLHWRK